MEPPRVREQLTPRQQEVLGLLRTGLTDGEIAQRLAISRSTASQHVAEIIAKLGVRNRREAAYYPERPPWWLALGAPFGHSRAGSIATVVAVGVLAAVLASLGLVAFLLTRGAGSAPNDAVVNGKLRLPQGAISALDSFAFTTTLDVSAADGDYALQFEGTFQKPDRIQGTIHLDGKFSDASNIYYGGLKDFEIAVVGEYVSWRAPGGEWQPGVDPNRGEQSDPLVAFRQYATPWFYLEAMRFDQLDLPVSGGAEKINGVRAIPVRLDKQGIIDVIRQGLGIKLYPDEPRTPTGPIGPGVLGVVQQELPQKFNINVWFEEHDLYPARIEFDYAVTEADYSTLAFGFERPMTLRMQMDIVDPHAGATIEPPIPIMTPTPEPTTPPGATIPVLSEEQTSRIKEIALADPRLRALLEGRVYTTSDVYLWTSSNLQLIGGGVNFTFAEPQTIETDWPSVDKNDSSRVTNIHYKAEQVEELTVLVALDRQQLVEIQPYGNAVKISNATLPANFTPRPSSGE